MASPSHTANGANQPNSSKNSIQLRNISLLFVVLFGSMYIDHESAGDLSGLSIPSLWAPVKADVFS